MEEKFDKYKEEHAKEHVSLGERILKVEFKVKDHSKTFDSISKVLWLFIGGMLTAAGTGFVAFLLSKGG